MTQDEIEAFFSAKGRYLCARWSRPVAPVIFGLADESLAIFRAAITAVLRDIRHPLTETDPEMGANLMVFFVRDWVELDDVPDLATLTGLPDLSRRLIADKAEQYRLFRFDPDGSIRACLVFIKMSGALADTHPGQLAETIAVGAMLTFAREVRPSEGVAALLRAAYDPIMPAVAQDPSHALRLAARLAMSSPRLS
ncbi:hypothetical protein JCM7686_0470 [Paracoccus aminophilus JCM 7686]|uniref:Uncharacterized protein n=2 Tax=Paracoccus aminophilus TaxID=34003 RepID=S5XK79_PARAH|nr:hypothetical protein JCM7686_0470 [Paracoccus aminophilus JCM 7686]